MQTTTNLCCTNHYSMTMGCQLIGKALCGSGPAYHYLVWGTVFVGFVTTDSVSCCSMGMIAIVVSTSLYTVLTDTRIRCERLRITNTLTIIAPDAMIMIARCGYRDLWCKLW